MHNTEPGTAAASVVMVVDDEPELVAVLREVLESEGYRVLAGLDAGRAPLEIEQAQPDLVILDVRMRGAPDFQVLRAIKGNPTTATIPVLLCTALHPEGAELQEEVARHGCELLLKPFELDTLVELVKQLIS